MLLSWHIPVAAIEAHDLPDVQAEVLGDHGQRAASLAAAIIDVEAAVSEKDNLLL